MILSDDTGDESDELVMIVDTLIQYVDQTDLVAQLIHMLCALV